MRRRSGRDRSGHAGRDAGLDLAVRCGGTTGRGSAASTTGRRLGLSIDNLIEADVVLADGSFFTANEEAHPDLLWALRGGGGNFGVVTRFSFRLSPVSTVVAGPTLWPLDRAAEILSWYRATSSATRPRSSAAGSRSSPCLPRRRSRSTCNFRRCAASSGAGAEIRTKRSRRLGPRARPGGATSYPRSRT